jgi:hypothetical protein
MLPHSFDMLDLLVLISAWNHHLLALLAQSYVNACDYDRVCDGVPVRLLRASTRARAA